MTIVKNTDVPDIDSGVYLPEMTTNDPTNFFVQPHISQNWFWTRIKDTVEVYGYMYIQNQNSVDPLGFNAFVSLPDAGIPGGLVGVFDLVGSEIDANEPVVLDIEAIRVLKPGKYELDLVHLFKNEPLIFKLEEGKYMIDILETFRQFSGKKKDKKD